MPSCAALGCNNRRENGFSLKKFPRDKVIRAIWASKVKKEGWTPTESSFLCEMHFESSMWEKTRQDGSRKLKADAIPTLFAQEQVDSSPHAPWEISGEELICHLKVHFDESQFESHRADGLRKLKPYAIPTIFNHSTSQRAKRTRKTFTNTRIEDGGHTYLKQDEEDNVDDPDPVDQEQGNIQEKHSEVILKSKHDPSVRGRKRGRPPKIQGNPDPDADAYADEWTPEIKRATRGRKRGRPPGSFKKQCLSALPSVKSAHISKRGRKKKTLPDRTVSRRMATEDEFRQIDSGEKNEEHCYVCNKLVDSGTPLNTRTTTTKVHLYQKLMKVLAVEMGEMVIEEEEVLCPHCTRLLNYMDRIEVELNMLSKAILNCMRRKFGMSGTNEDKVHETVLLDLEEQQDSSSDMDKLNFRHSSRDDADSEPFECQWVDAEDEPQEVQAISAENVEKMSISEENVISKETLLEHEFQCRVCMFKTNFRSVIVYHLRQHLKDTFRCDFCNVSLPFEPCKSNKSETNQTKHIVEVDVTSGVDELESQCQNEIAKTQSSVVKELGENVQIAGAVGETEVSGCDSPEPQVLMTLVSHSNNGNQLTVLSDSGISGVHESQKDMYSFTLDYANEHVTGKGSNDAVEEPCDFLANFNKDITDHSFDSEIQEGKDESNMCDGPPVEEVPNSNHVVLNNKTVLISESSGTLVTEVQNEISNENSAISLIND